MTLQIQLKHCEFVFTARRIIVDTNEAFNTAACIQKLHFKVTCILKFEKQRAQSIITRIFRINAVIQKSLQK